MKLLYKRGAAILLLIAIVALSFSGCVTPSSVADTSTQAPGASSLVQTNNIQDGAVTSVKIAPGTIASSNIAAKAVNDTHLTANAIVTNYTTNTTVSITSNIPFVNISTGGVLVLNRSSLVEMVYSTQLRSTGDAYMRLMVDGFEQAPGIIFAGNGTGTNNRTALASYTWVNASLLSGSHGYYVQGNVSEGTLILSNATLIGIAYPK